MTIELVDVYHNGIPKQAAVHLLYSYLAQRQPDQSISHVEMPSMEQHGAFVARKPYAHWYLIRMVGPAAKFVGSIYITPMREVGIHIDERQRGKGYGTQALEALRKLHAGRLLANVNPRNKKSISFWEHHGARLLQLTFELR